MVEITGKVVSADPSSSIAAVSAKGDARGADVEG
jgi:hypothetical protein